MSNQLHNALDQATALTLAYRRMFGGDADLSVERLGETLTPVVDAWSHPWCAWYRGEVLFAGMVEPGAVAGELSAAAIVNPAGTNLIAIVDVVSVLGIGVAQAVSLCTGTEAVIAATLATTSAFSRRDFRATGVTGLVMRSGSDVATVGTQLETFGAPLNQRQEALSVPYVLTPGFGVLVQSLTANANFRANFSGSVRRMLPGEDK